MVTRSESTPCSPDAASKVCQRAAPDDCTAACNPSGLMIGSVNPLLGQVRSGTRRKRTADCRAITSCAGSLPPTSRGKRPDPSVATGGLPPPAMPPQPTIRSTAGARANPRDPIARRGLGADLRHTAHGPFAGSIGAIGSTGCSPLLSGRLRLFRSTSPWLVAFSGWLKISSRSRSSAL